VNNAKLKLKLKKTELLALPNTIQEYTFQISFNFDKPRPHKSFPSEARRANHTDFHVISPVLEHRLIREKILAILKFRYLRNQWSFFDD
jgi:hypothetical protein